MKTFRSIYYKFKAYLYNIRIGRSVYFKDCRFEGENYLSDKCILKGSELGFLSYVGSNSKIENTIIGRYTSVGPEVLIGLGEHPTDRLSTHPVFYKKFKHTKVIFANIENFLEHKQTDIGSDCWIGARSIIRAGVKVGNGAIIAAGSVVTKDVEDFAIVGGNPARFIRTRFNKNTLATSQIGEWWNWDLEKIQENIALFQKIETLE
jgi:acetyltransferase-like isoleucine patch superfamily enzyme